MLSRKHKINFHLHHILLAPARVGVFYFPNVKVLNYFDLPIDIVRRSTYICIVIIQKQKN